MTLGGEAVIIGAFEHARFFAGRSADRYARLAEQAAFVVALGQGLSAEPVPECAAPTCAPTTR